MSLRFMEWLTYIIITLALACMVLMCVAIAKRPSLKCEDFKDVSRESTPARCFNDFHPETP
jgi:hypothetical protein